MTFKFKKVGKATIRNPILIEGLPGIGNVGKIAADFIVDSLKAKKIYEVYSYNFPHAVFVNEKNLVELPVIDMYSARVKGQDLLLLVGDIQPIDEVSCYEFCDGVLDLVEKYNCKEVITIGGIGLQDIPTDPMVFCTANDPKMVKRYHSPKLRTDIHGVVGPIIGVSGLLVGLAGQRNISSIAFLAETYGHPNYLGIKGARAVLEILNKHLKLNLDLQQLDEEIGKIEKEIKTKIRQIESLQKGSSKRSVETNYIG